MAWNTPCSYPVNSGAHFDWTLGARPVEAEGRGGCLSLCVACRRLVSGVGLDDVVQDGLVQVLDGGGADDAFGRGEAM